MPQRQGMHFVCMQPYLGLWGCTVSGIRGLQLAECQVMCVCRRVWLHLQDQPCNTFVQCTADAQKLAKQAIYSLYRGDYDRAEQQLASVGGQPVQ
jgi:hypothetical protein